MSDDRDLGEKDFADQSDEERMLHHIKRLGDDLDGQSELTGQYFAALERIRTIVQASFLRGPSAYNRVLAIRRIFDEMEGGDPVRGSDDE